MSPESAHAVYTHLAKIGDPLFALLDAARDSRVLPAIEASGQPYESLYEGADADDLAAYGPFLVSLAGGDDFLTRLVAAGWGQSWGVYLASPADFATIRHHLRHYVKVEIPSASSALFRFYDPRVLREFLEVWTTAERDAFFGPLSCCILEDAEGSTAPLEYRPAVIAHQPPTRWN